MERLTIDGGEVWLGFARNRVKALKRAGIRYTRQVFEMPDGAKVIIEMAGKDHAIRLMHSVDTRIMSGIVKGGELVKLPIPPGSPKGTKPPTALKAFKATADAAAKVFKKKEMAKKFENIQSLNTPLTLKTKFYDPKELKTQAGVINPGKYSGEMRRFVQILLGLKEQVEITYNYTFRDSDGIHKAKDGSFWLVKISDSGVWAAPLDFLKVSMGGSSAEKECIKLYDGIPTGNVFPKNWSDAVKEGKMLKLLNSTDMNEFYGLSPYFKDCGWSFNKDGTEAHNTGFKLVEGAAHSFHYKLEILITPKTDSAKASGTASISKVSSGALLYTESKVFMYSGQWREQQPLIYFHDENDSQSLYKIVDKKLKRSDDTFPYVTVFVGHRKNGKLFTVGYKASQTYEKWAEFKTYLTSDPYEDPRISPMYPEPFKRRIELVIDGEVVKDDFPDLITRCKQKIFFRTSTTSGYNSARKWGYKPAKIWINTGFFWGGSEVDGYRFYEAGTENFATFQQWGSTGAWFAEDTVSYTTHNPDDIQFANIDGIRDGYIVTKTRHKAKKKVDHHKGKEIHRSFEDGKSYQIYRDSWYEVNWDSRDGPDTALIYANGIACYPNKGKKYVTYYPSPERRDDIGMIYVDYSPGRSTTTISPPSAVSSSSYPATLTDVPAKISVVTEPPELVTELKDSDIESTSFEVGFQPQTSPALKARVSFFGKGMAAISCFKPRNVEIVSHTGGIFEGEPKGNLAPDTDFKNYNFIGYV